MVIIDLVQISDGTDHYKALEARDNKSNTTVIYLHAELATEMVTLITVRYWIVILQVLAIGITWLSQWWTDVYLITLPIAFVSFCGILSMNVFFIDHDKWHDLDLSTKDDELINACYQFLHQATVPMKINVAVIAFTCAVN